MTSLRTNKSTNGRMSEGVGISSRILEKVPFLSGPLLCQLFLTPRSRARRGSKGGGEEVGRIKVGRLRLCVRARGRGPSVLLVHGWQSHSGKMSELAASIVSKGYTVITVDMPAHGESPGHVSSIPRFVETILETAKLVGPLHTVVAHSLGATATTIALHQGLHCQGAVLIAPMVSFDFALDEFQKVLKLSPGLRELTARRTEARVGLTRAESDLATLSPPRVPLLLCHDEEDTRTPIEHTKDLASRWPDVQLKITSGLGHSGILKDLQIHGEIASFMDGLVGAADSPWEGFFNLAPELRI